MKRDHLKIFASPSLVLSQNSAQLQHSLENSGGEPDTFTSMLTNLVHSRRTASTARAVGAAFRQLAFVVARPAIVLVLLCMLRPTYLPSLVIGLMHLASCTVQLAPEAPAV